MLLEAFLNPLGMTQRELADSIRVPYLRVNEIVKSRRGNTPGMALQLARVFSMSAAFWMSLQLRWDLHHAQRAEVMGTIQPLSTAS